MPAFDFILAGRYRLVAPLGEGGMAAVYRGRDLRLNRDVAVKVLRDDLTRDPEFRSRFEREAQFLASLSHPNIVPVYDVGEEQGTHYIVMEYVPGRTLHEAIRAEGRIGPSRAVPIMSQVLDALGYAHGQGIIHRDIKPHNVLMTAGGVPRLADFGIAHLAGGSATQTAVIMGSAHYISPEQSRGEPATEQSDLYSCGVVLYEMLAGTPPFDGPNALVVATQHISGTPAALTDRFPDVDPQLESVVLTALAKDPTGRFSGAVEFAGRMQEALTVPAEDATQVLPLLTRVEPQPLVDKPRHARVPAQVRLRRSTRKTGLLAASLCAVLLGLWYISSMPVGAKLPQYPSAPYALVVLLPALLVLASWVQARSWQYSVDGSSAVVQWGVLAHHRFGIPLYQVSSLELKQSLVDRILRVGTVELLARDTHGVERRLVLEDLARPRQAYEDLMRAVAVTLYREGTPGNT